MTILMCTQIREYPPGFAHDFQPPKPHDASRRGELECGHSPRPQVWQRVT